MFSRLVALPKKKIFFLFGARGTSKTTLLKNLSWYENVFYINLLRADMENRLSRNPDSLRAMVEHFHTQ